MVNTTSGTFDLEFLTVPEVAAMLRCSVSTIYKMVETNRLNANRVGGRLIFDRVEVLEWVRSHATTIPTKSGKGGLS
jgi:excisionase family DNA binding protein